MAAAPGERDTQLLVMASSDLDPADRAAAKGFLGQQFEGWTRDDWEHCLGGVHVLVRRGRRLIGHGSLVPRQLEHDGRRLAAGYVEGLAVAGDHRGSGVGSRIMQALEDLADQRYEIAALSATEAAQDFYRQRGWLLWRGPTAVVGGSGVERTPDDDGGIFVRLIAAAVDLDGQLACDCRAGDLW